MFFKPPFQETDSSFSVMRLLLMKKHPGKTVGSMTSLRVFVNSLRQSMLTMLVGEFQVSFCQQTRHCIPTVAVLASDNIIQQKQGVIMVSCTGVYVMPQCHMRSTVTHMPVALKQLSVIQLHVIQPSNITSTW